MPPIGGIYKGTLLCFLCREIINYKDNDSTKLKKHMKKVHMIKFGFEYILAGCIMSKDERLAVKEVVKGRIEQGEHADDVTLEESSVSSPKTSVSSPKTSVSDCQETRKRFHCNKCPLSFSKQRHLNDHLEKKHLKRKIRADDVNSHSSKKNLSQEVQKISAVTALKVESRIKIECKRKTEDQEASSTATTSVKKIKTPNQENSESNKNQTAGDGTTCPVCSKKFSQNGPMKRHFEDIHKPGNYPCQGCKKVFTSKNKMSSHYSRHCNPNRKNRRTL